MSAEFNDWPVEWWDAEGEPAFTAGAAADALEWLVSFRRKLAARLSPDGALRLNDCISELEKALARERVTQ